MRPSNRSRRRWIAILAVAVLLLVGLWGLAIGPAVHAATNPSFAEYVATHAVPEARVMARFEEREVLAHTTAPAAGATFRLGGVDPGDLAEDDRASCEIDLEILRGDAVLLHVRQVILAALDEDGSRSGIRVGLEEFSVAPDLRAHVRVALEPADDELLGPGSEGVGRSELHIVLASGAGDSTYELVRGLGPVPLRGDDSWPAPSTAWNLAGESARPGWRAILGLLLHPFGAPPEDGWAVECRQRSDLTWRLDGGSMQSASYSPFEYACNTSEYSNAFRLRWTSTVPGSGPMRHEVESHVTHWILGEIW